MRMAASPLHRMLAFRWLSGACQFFHELPHLALGLIPEDLVLDKDSLPKVKMPIGDDYARLPDWKPGTPRLEGYPY